VSDKIIFDPPWMRQRAAECDAEKEVIQRLLRPADEAVGKLRKAAAGWTFLSSLDDMANRWENLNKLLRASLTITQERFETPQTIMAKTRTSLKS